MKIIAIVTLFFLGLALSANVAWAATDYKGTLMNNVSSGCIDKGDCNPCDMIQVGVNLSDMIVTFTGAIAILMFIVGGIVMITSYGSDRITMGKNIIVAALIGILIIFAAWTIVNTLILAFYGPTAGVFPSALSSFSSSGSLREYKCR